MLTMIRYALPVATAAMIFTPIVASAGEVYHRELHQEQRIYNGVRDGQITPAEFRNLERREALINAQRAVDLRRDNQHLTRLNQLQLNRRLDSVSAAIYRDRHD
ncbi:MAG: hypothetical protein C4288_18295 [Leptolyngbya sp. ERB_1_1]